MISWRNDGPPGPSGSADDRDDADRLAGRSPQETPVTLPRLPDSVMAAARMVASRVEIGPVAPVGVTSVASGEGRTTIATALAEVLGAERGHAVVLIELDRDRSTWPGAVGLADVLTGAVDLPDAMHWPHPQVAVLPVGRGAADGDDLLRLFARSGVLAALRAQDMVVVADLPPLPPAGDGDRVASSFEIVLLVVRAGVTTSAQVKAGVATLDRDPVVVLNRTSSAVPGWLRLGWRS